MNFRSPEIFYSESERLSQRPAQVALFASLRERAERDNRRLACKAHMPAEFRRPRSEVDGRLAGGASCRKGIADVRFATLEHKREITVSELVRLLKDLGQDAELADKWEGDPDSVLKDYNLDADMIKALRAGDVDAVKKASGMENLYLTNVTVKAY